MHLFVSDLDGTLLNSNQSISDFTANTINYLVKQCSLNFTISTARSLDSAWPLISKLELHLPIILHNGAFLYDPNTKKYLVRNVISFSEMKMIIEEIERRNLNPIIYSTNEFHQNKIFYKGIFNYGEQEYFGKRLKAGDKRLELRDKYLFTDHFEAVSVNTIDTKQNLSEIFTFFQNNQNFYSHFAQDIYSGFFWLEITHQRANKKTALQDLKFLSKAKMVSSFGDNLNDLPMFQESDYSYAVSNAHESLKNVSTKIIESNDEDGVAKFLIEYFN